MSKKNIILKSERISLVPMTEEEMKAQIKSETDPHNKEAYTELLDGMVKEPTDYLWYTCWKIIPNGDTNAIGEISFKGPHKNGTVEIGYGMLPAFQNQGYMTEAVKLITEWALKQRDVYSVVAETEPGNRASQRVLEKNGFIMYANGSEGPRYQIESKPFYWVLIFFLMFSGCGVIVGIILSKIMMFMYIGMGVGLALGLTLDLSFIQHKKRITKK